MFRQKFKFELFANQAKKSLEFVLFFINSFNCKAYQSKS